MPNSVSLNASNLRANLISFSPHSITRHGSLDPPNLLLICQTSNGEIVNLMLNLKEAFSAVRESNEVPIRSILSGFFS